MNMLGWECQLGIKSDVSVHCLHPSLLLVVVVAAPAAHDLALHAEFSATPPAYMEYCLVVQRAVEVCMQRR